ncbi:hypothetical protein F442_11002 [Phytophthora nicotianae P10297]|uniref:Uncharacterized protein n=2 Tax=Phytophthora nicotianae TaxID=4792 RepID=W2Z446_PHYNI|nr:hypothetical protein L914_10660 [Phytophthora nicotianae]ETP42063.1 hypothetical protein F442_11002 [Phytophthora nicotianae P10297]
MSTRSTNVRKQRTSRSLYGGGSEISNHISSNPFDSPTSDRDPFPSFMAALADEQSVEETEEGSALNWSIDTLAELKPVTFSPLPQQKDAVNTSGTPHRTSGFFEDEKQYEVLRTPLPAGRPSNMTTIMLTPSPAPPIERHRSRKKTLTQCESALRERQYNTNRMQVALPPPTPKRSAHQRATPPSRSTPLQPAKRIRFSTAVTPMNEWKSPAMRPPKWSASPTGMVVNRQPLCATPATLHFDTMTSSPLVNSPRNVTPKQSSKLRLSFGLSPITFPSPQVEEKIEEEKSKEDKPSNEDTITAVSESDKENSDRQTKERSSSSHSTSRMRPPASMEPARSSIPRRRQQAFIEAMEAEAQQQRKAQA